MNQFWAVIGTALGLLCAACSCSLGGDDLTGVGARRDGPPSADAIPRLPAFPGAVGWGSDATGGRGGFVDDPANVGGWPTLADMTAVPGDTDDDGMADVWETHNFGSLTTGPNEDADGDGYTNLEEYLHHLAAGGGVVLVK